MTTMQTLSTRLSDSFNMNEAMNEDIADFKECVKAILDGEATDAQITTAFYLLDDFGGTCEEVFDLYSRVVAQNRVSDSQLEYISRGCMGLKNQNCDPAKILNAIMQKHYESISEETSELIRGYLSILEA